MKELIERLKYEIATDLKSGDDPNERDFGKEIGILISINEAREFVILLEKYHKPPVWKGKIDP